MTYNIFFFRKLPDWLLGWWANKDTNEICIDIKSSTPDDELDIFTRTIGSNRQFTCYKEQYFGRKQFANSNAFYTLEHKISSGSPLIIIASQTDMNLQTENRHHQSLGLLVHDVIRRKPFLLTAAYYVHVVRELSNPATLFTTEFLSNGAVAQEILSKKFIGYCGPGASVYKSATLEHGEYEIPYLVDSLLLSVYDMFLSCEHVDISNTDLYGQKLECEIFRG